MKETSIYMQPSGILPKQSNIFEKFGLKILSLNMLNMNRKYCWCAVFDTEDVSKVLKRLFEFTLNKKAHLLNQLLTF